MKFWEFIRKALSEDDQSPSALRLFSAWLVFVFVLVLAFGFIWVLLYHEDLILLYATILTSAIAGVLGIKVWQKGKENDANPS
jgi:cytoskeletal protein RodZ